MTFEMMSILDDRSFQESVICITGNNKSKLTGKSFVEAGLEGKSFSSRAASDAVSKGAAVCSSKSDKHVYKLNPP